MNFRLAFLTVILWMPQAYAVSGTEEEMKAFQDLQLDIPDDAQAYFERLRICHHWAGEALTDKERKAQMVKSVRVERCNALAKDEKQLVKKHKKHAKFAKALALSKKLFR